MWRKGPIVGVVGGKYKVDFAGAGIQVLKDNDDIVHESIQVSRLKVKRRRLLLKNRLLLAEIEADA